MWSKNISTYDLLWSDENIIRFLNKNYKRDKRENINVLEIGCGAGRNIIGIYMEGFKTFGIDYNKNGIELSQKKVELFSLKDVDLKCNTGSFIPYEDEQFDCIIIGGTLMIVSKNDRDVMIREINRCLKKDGIVYSIWRDKTDYFYGKGTKVEDDNTFILQENKYGISNMIYNFRDKEEIIKFYNKYGFEIYNIEKKDFYIEHLKVKNSHWHIWAKKI